MKKTLILISAITILSSCQYKVDDTNPFGVADAIHEGLIRNDSTILQNVFKYQMDSLSERSLENLAEAKEIYQNNKNINVIKIDTSTLWFNDKIIDMFCRTNGNFYRIRTYYLPDSTTSKVKPTDFYFTNLNKECEDYNNTPWNPKYDINFKRISWNTDYYGKTFKYGAVELQNNTEYDLNFVKFRVILKHGDYSWSAETFLNQTVESYKPLYKGDIVKIDIPGMTDYFTGFKIEQDELFFDAELIEVKPKPVSFWCTTLEELKEEALKQENHEQ